MKFLGATSPRSRGRSGAALLCAGALETLARRYRGFSISRRPCSRGPAGANPEAAQGAAVFQARGAIAKIGSEIGVGAGFHAAAFCAVLRAAAAASGRGNRARVMAEKIETFWRAQRSPGVRPSITGARGRRR